MVQKFKTEHLDRFMDLTYRNSSLTQKAYSVLRTLHAFYGPYIPKWQLQVRDSANWEVSFEVQRAYQEIQLRRTNEPKLNRILIGKGASTK